MQFSHIDLKKPTLVLIDTSVALHRFSQGNSGISHKDPMFIPVLKANMVALANCCWLPLEVQNTVAGTIFTIDTKQNGKYWRHDWLLDPANYLRVPAKTKKKEVTRLELLAAYESGNALDDEVLKPYKIHYKAGRSLPDYRFKKVKSNVLDWIETDELGSGGIGLSNYESDDLMATIVDLNTRSGSVYNIIIYTVDADLIGLVNPSVTWLCMSGYHPGIRDTLESVNTWTQKLDSKGKMKLGVVDSWTDIWVQKGFVGDKSDSLPASNGVLLPVIDLLNPPSEHRLVDRPEIVTAINSILKSPARPSYDEGQRALKYLNSTGTVPAFKRYCDIPVSSTKVPDYAYSK